MNIEVEEPDEWLPRIDPNAPYNEYKKQMALQKCVKCNMHRTQAGHDPCIANLPGVNFACCGHGVAEGYVSFIDGRVIRGYFDHVRYK